MKSSFKSILIFILCFTLSFPVGAVAPDNNPDISIGSCVVARDPNTDTRYALPILTYSLNGERAYADTTVYYDTVDAFVKAMRKQMTERKNTIVIGYKTNTLLTEDFYDIIADKLFIHTGNPKEGDYLWFNLGGYSASSKGYRENSIYYYTFTFDITYYTTYEQEAEIDAAIADLSGQILSNCSSDYEIVKTIYDYICNNITYDYYNLNNTDYKLQFTAYAALINKTAVCQGYANLFYRLALACGIENRIISGISSNTSHAWNIVKLNGYYYNLDSTWDSTLAQMHREYEFFLKCDDNFDDHCPSERYLTEDFIASHPKYDKDYNIKDPAHRHEYSDWHLDRYATLASSGEKSRYCQCGDRAYVTEIPYIDSAYIYKNYKTKSWSCDGIDFVSSNGFMGDTGAGDFEQTGTMTRAMFVTVLWRIAGMPDAYGESIFNDLNAKQTWYHDAVIWAYENGLVNGTSANTFSPNGEVTREQIAAFLYRYITNYLGSDLSTETVDISSFPDCNLIGSYAIDALAWTYSTGLIKGKTGNDGILYLAPNNNATREEVAVIIARFCGQN